MAHKIDSQPTSDEYVNGLIKSLDRAIVWVETFKGRIEKRPPSSIRELDINRGTKIATYKQIIAKLLQEKKKIIKNFNEIKGNE